MGALPGGRGKIILPAWAPVQLQRDRSGFLSGRYKTLGSYKFISGSDGRILTIDGASGKIVASGRTPE